MPTNTPISLLELLRTNPNSESWQQFHALYAPLLRTWLEKQQIQPADADDLVQEVLQVIVRRLPEFHHNSKPGAFRSWLRTILTFQLRNFMRARQNRPSSGGPALERLLLHLEDPASELNKRWDRDHDRELMRQVLKLIEPEFEKVTWQVFCRLILDEVPTAIVAKEFDLTTNAVRIAKSRVLRRLRQEIVLIEPD